MKKKLLLFICIIATLAVVLSGCISKPPHKMFSDPWLNYEEITYDVTRSLENGDKITGTSKIITERVTNNNDKKIGDETLKNFSGTYISIHTELSDGSVMDAQVAFMSSFEPVASYKEVKVKGYPNNSPSQDIHQITKINYRDEKCLYSTDFDGVKNSGDIKTGKWIKKPFYDNLMLYHIARSSYLKGAFSSLSPRVFSVSDFEFKNLTVSLDKSAEIFKLFPEQETGIKTDVVKLTLNQTFPGSGEPLTVRLSREVKEIKTGLNLSTDRIPLVINEGDMEYKISGYTANK